MIDVTCAIIRNEDDDLLVVQRGEKTDHPFLWEFPGGKTREGEKYEECIIREIAEELSIGIVICSRLPEVEYDYGHKQIKLIPFVCDTLDEIPVLSEHKAYRWVPVAGLNEVDFCGADALVAENYTNSLSYATVNHITDVGHQAVSGVNDEELQEMINNMISMKEADWVVISALENPAIFLKLMEYSYSADRKLAFRASWTLSKVCDRYPEVFYPYLTELVEALPKTENESVERSFLRILSLSSMERLSERHRGILADHCFTALNSAASAIAVKAYSMEILYSLSLIYPQLANELAASIRSVMEEGSAGIVSKGNTILKRITGIPLDSQSSQK